MTRRRFYYVGPVGAAARDGASSQELGLLRRALEHQLAKREEWRAVVETGEAPPHVERKLRELETELLARESAGRRSLAAILKADDEDLERIGADAIDALPDILMRVDR